MGIKKNKKSSLLEGSFIHIPQIGYITESYFWSEGYLNWTELLNDLHKIKIPNSKKRIIDKYLIKSLKSLEKKDTHFFSKAFPKNEYWRLYSYFSEDSLFLDIETTGLIPGCDYITVIGASTHKKYYTLIRDRNFEKLYDLLRNARILITYNGSQFDIKFIEKEFSISKFKFIHIDLRWLLSRLGYKGGLKKCEKSLGIKRDKKIIDIDGYMAVLLWDRYLKGDFRALNVLKRYCIEDTTNLITLMHKSYNLVLNSLDFPVKTYFEERKTMKIKIPFDNSIVRELKKSYHYDYFY